MPDVRWDGQDSGWPTRCRLLSPGRESHPPGLFAVSEAEAAAIPAVYEQRGELSAAVELRRLFPSVFNTAQARECARIIAGWKPLPLHPLRRREVAPGG